MRKKPARRRPAKSRKSPAIESRFSAGVDDIVIIPLVFVAASGKNLLRSMLSVLIRVVDYAFPILLRLMQIPLFTMRITGDSFAGALKLAVSWLPVSEFSRTRWREAVSSRWQWLRQKLSYKAFEEAVHHAFENGMAWVFRRCKDLTPRGALLTIAGAVLWLPASFGAATALHAVLIAKAASLPPWMQLLHPLATVIAKSKLLVLPVYPAAWPQAKRHGTVRAMFQFYRVAAKLKLVRKTAYRYRQTASTLSGTADRVRQAAPLTAIGQGSGRLLATVRDMAAQIGQTSRNASSRITAALSKAPLIGALLRSYAARYGDAKPPRTEKLSERVRNFFDQWSIKFSAEYYETREREQAMQRRTGPRTAHP